MKEKKNTTFKHVNENKVKRKTKREQKNTANKD